MALLRKESCNSRHPKELEDGDCVWGCVMWGYACMHMCIDQHHIHMFTHTHIHCIHLLTTYTHSPCTHTHHIRTLTTYPHSPHTHTRHMHTLTTYIQCDRIHTLITNSHSPHTHTVTTYTHSPHTHTHLIRTLTTYTHSPHATSTHVFAHIYAQIAVPKPLLSNQQMT